MTLDRLISPNLPVFDGRHHCGRCGDNVRDLTAAGLCAYCDHQPTRLPPRAGTPKENDMTSQPDPRFPNVPAEQIGSTVLLPEYCVDVAELLAATENHRDAGVRAIRKIVIQAALALDHAQQAVPPACRECGCTNDEACFPTCSWVEPDLCSACTPQTSGSDAPRALPAPGLTSTSEPETGFELFTKKRKSSAAVLLMAEHQIAAADVRSWAVQQGIPVAGRGGLPVDLVQQYLTERGAA